MSVIRSSGKLEISISVRGKQLPVRSAQFMFVHWLLEVHFRGAWRKLQEIEARLGTTRTERTTGGPRGGGTRLTATGQDGVHQMRWWTAGLQELIEPQLAEVFEAS